MPYGTTAPLEELIAIRHMAERLRAKSLQNKGEKNGLFLSKTRGQGMEFAEIAHYGGGSHDIRHIEWRVTAKTGKPHIKRFEEEQERTVFIITDFSKRMHFGTRVAFKSVIAAHLSAWISWVAFLQGSRVGGCFFSENEDIKIEPSFSEKNLLSMLNHLSKATKTKPFSTDLKQPAFQTILEKINRTTRQRSIIILVSDFDDIESVPTTYLSYLRKKHDVLAYQIRDPLELAAPPRDCYTFSNGEETLSLDFALKETEKNYRDFFQNRQTTVNETFRRHHIPLITLTAYDTLSSLIEKTFLRRAYVR